MDPRNLKRLKEEQLQAAEETKHEIKQWEKYDKDYSELQKRLETLPDKVTYDAMIPFGSLAFMPGQLIHTNEVLVLLGDNWFTVRSAKQACQIIDRRKKQIDKMLEDLHKQLGLLESRLDFTSDIHNEISGAGDIVDIREDYDPEEEAKWREERKRKKREEASRKLDETHKEQGQTADRNTQEEIDLWARLDELERQEEELDELALRLSDEENGNDEDDGGDTSDEAENTSNNKKKVKWKDQTNSVPTIYFKHSDSPATSPCTDSGTIQNPADIYQQFKTMSKSDVGKEEPKSILKPTKPGIDIVPEVADLPEKPIKKKVILPAPIEAFSGTIVEKKSEPSLSNHPTTSQPDIKEEEKQVEYGTDDGLEKGAAQAQKAPAPKKLSKFKAARQSKGSR